MVKKYYLFMLCLIFKSISFTLASFAQTAPVPKKLIFPIAETHFAFQQMIYVDNPEGALSADLNEYSIVINHHQSGSNPFPMSQTLIFEENVPVGSVIKVKISISQLLIEDDIHTIEIRKLKSDNPYNIIGREKVNVNFGSYMSSLGNILEVPILVEEGEVIDAVQITSLSFRTRMHVYGAYYEVEEEYPNCDQFDAYTHTSGAQNLSITNQVVMPLGTVTEASNAFDKDLFTYATMSRRQRLEQGNVYLNGHFLSNGMMGDQIRLTLSSTLNLTDIELLNPLKIVFYNNEQEVSGIPLAYMSSAIITDSSAPTGTVTLEIPTFVNFNKVSLEFDNHMGLSLYDELRVHEIRRIPAAPNIQLGSNDTLYAYVGTTVDLEATPTLVSDEVLWYDSNDQQVHTGTQYTTPTIQGEVIYQVLASRYNCIVDTSLARIITILTKNVAPNVLGMVNANQSYADALAMEGADAQSVNYSYTLVSGVLPSGLILNPDGTISGTTTDLGVFSIEVQVQDLTNGIDAGVYHWELEVVDPLNLNLVSFTADWNAQKNVLLTWETVSTSNIEFFKVQKSIDGKSWETMAQILSNDRHQYTFEDVAAQSHSSNYYRLELVEDRGTSFSKVVQLLNHHIAVESPMVYPNPANQWIQIQHSQELTQVSVYNLVGQLVYKVEQPPSSISLDHLSAGQYMIVITDANGQVFQQKIMKH